MEIGREWRWEGSGDREGVEMGRRGGREGVEIGREWRWGGSGDGEWRWGGSGDGREWRWGGGNEKRRLDKPPAVMVSSAQVNTLMGGEPEQDACASGSSTVTMWRPAASCQYAIRDTLMEHTQPVW